MSLLDRWLFGRFLRTVLLFSASAALLFLTIDLFTNLDSLVQQGLLRAAAERYAAMLPELFFTLGPYLTVLGGLWVVVSLQRQNELVPLLAAGIGPRRLSAPLLMGAALFSVLTFVDRELLLPRLGDLRREDRMRKTWEAMRPIPDGSGGVLTARAYLPALQELQDPRYVALDERGGEAWTLIARRGRYSEEDGGWWFSDGVELRRASGAHGPEDAVAPVGSDGRLLPSRIRLSDVEAAVDSPAFLSASQLRAQLERTPGFKQLEVQLYERFTQPLAGLVLLLAGLPLLLARCTEGTGAVLGRALGVLGVAVAYFFVSTTLYELGGRGVVHPATAAFAPPLLFGGGGAALLWVGHR